jgi:2-amino-4-hydroxy-6-hydroxymethyldihydropteridine diphosphokinase
MRKRAFLSLGSNLGDREEYLREAVRFLHVEDSVVAVSDVFETEPVGGPEQSPYLNIVVELRTKRDAKSLLQLAEQMEETAGRKREVRWGPRTLDVDVLLVEGEHSDTDELRVPHPRMWERRFVLAPLRQLAPDLVPAHAVEAAHGEVRSLGALDWRPSVGTGRVRFIGRGRAGLSLAQALESVGWRIEGLLGRSDDVRGAAEGVDVLVIATPDDAVASVSAQVRPVEETLVVHLSGSLDLSALEPHPRRAGAHPLVSLPDASIGSRRLLRGVPFAVSGDADVSILVRSIGGRPFDIRDGQRVLYHAAACIASNHLVALMDQVKVVAQSAGLDEALYDELVDGTLENVRLMGTRAALTGPAARGDIGTLRRHLSSIPWDERESYVALARRAMRMSGHAPGLLETEGEER